MSRTRNLCAAAIVLAIALGCIIGCYSEHYPVYTRYDADAAGRAAIREYDTNGDGKIAGTALDKCPGVKAAVDKIDPSGHREVTGEVIAARIRAWEKSKLGMMAVHRHVTHNGRPLPDAEVKFVPEDFPSEYARTATGTTDKSGIAGDRQSGIRCDWQDAGRCPGFYRIEITKRGDDIPAKYNTATVLGVEIADGRRLDTEDTEEESR